MEKVRPPTPAFSPQLLVQDEVGHSHQVTDLPGLPFGYNHAMFAGDISVDEPTLENKGSIFYWLLESQDSPSTDPLLIWLNGGPGCSSMEGLLIEHGPFLAADRGFDLELNFFSWNRNANVLYVDQPVGTGFARVENGEYARSQSDVNVMFMAFLKRWMALHPGYSNHSIFLGGESYAGRYIPHFVREMELAGGFRIEGVLIGNGWTDPIVQSEALIEYSLSHGILSPQQKFEVDGLMRVCRSAYEEDAFSQQTWEHCEKIQTLPPALSGNSQIGRVNIYDVRLYDTSSGEEWPWRATGEHAYLNRPDVRQALHVKSRLSWEECSDDVEAALTHEDMFPTTQEFQDLIPKMRVLVYNGQFDWICNHLGVERFLDRINFEGREAYAKRGLWVTGSRLAGYVNSGGNLSYVLVLGGSHMVPMDKRPETFDLVTRFLQNRSFTDLHPHFEVTPDLKRRIPDEEQALELQGKFFTVVQGLDSPTTGVTGSSPRLLTAAQILVVFMVLVGFCRLVLLYKRAGYTTLKSEL
jgi:carboxypeptidase C (cathepsin A)